jgi:hypothetical protein
VPAATPLFSTKATKLTQGHKEKRAAAGDGVPDMKGSLINEPVLWPFMSLVPFLNKAELMTGMTGSCGGMGLQIGLV